MTREPRYGHPTARVTELPATHTTLTLLIVVVVSLSVAARRLKGKKSVSAAVVVTTETGVRTPNAPSADRRRN